MWTLGTNLPAPVITPKGLYKIAHGKRNAAMGQGIYKNSYTLKGLHKNPMAHSQIYFSSIGLCIPFREYVNGRASVFPGWRFAYPGLFYFALSGQCLCTLKRIIRWVALIAAIRVVRQEVLIFAQRPPAPIGAPIAAIGATHYYILPFQGNVL